MEMVRYLRDSQWPDSRHILRHPEPVDRGTDVVLALGSLLPSLIPILIGIPRRGKLSAPACHPTTLDPEGQPSDGTGSRMEWVPEPVPVQHHLAPDVLNDI